MKELEKRLLEIIGQYLKEEEALGDFVRLAINPDTLDVSLESDPDTDDPALDYFEIPDLLLMNPDGSWTPDPEAIADVVEEYNS